MSEITVRPLGPNEFGVQVREGDTTTSHKVTVPEELLDDLIIEPERVPVLVEESFGFLLEREPAASILSEFTLDDISRFFPEYREEIVARLG